MKKAGSQWKQMYEKNLSPYEKWLVKQASNSGASSFKKQKESAPSIKGFTERFLSSVFNM